MTLPPANPSALSPQGPEASAIFDLATVMTVGAAGVLLLVVVLAVLALRAPRPRLATTALVVAGGIAFPAVVLVALHAYTLHAQWRAGASTPDVAIEVVGHQWWWRVHYLDGSGSRDFATANEIRIPTGRTVEVRLRSADVLHSFWVPALAGKLDLVPGRDNRLRFSASSAGTFRGQCAEYCGGPHAQMALFVVAEAPEAFEAWRRAQRDARSAAAAGTGEALFLARCASCHTVRGTAAAGTRGPDLTHVGSRLSLGAGILPNDAAAAARWIASGQHVKPGNLMPEFRDLAPEELRAVAAYVVALR